MMTIEAIRSDLGHKVFLISCSCPWKFLINLERKLPGYDPETGIVRCPHCGDTARKESVLMAKENTGKHGEELDNFINNVRNTWTGEETKEEQK